MKRALGVIVSAAFKAGNITLHNVGYGVGVSVRNGKLVQIRKFLTAIAALFLSHIGCGAHALILSVAPPEKVALFYRTVSAFQHFISHNRKKSANAIRFKDGRAHA